MKVIAKLWVNGNLKPLPDIVATLQYNNASRSVVHKLLPKLWVKGVTRVEIEHSGQTRERV